MLQISRASTRVETGEAEVSRLRAHFDAHHWVKLSQVLRPDLLWDVHHRLAGADFVERVHAGVTPPSVDLSMVPSVLSGLLELVFNDRALFDLVERITGCEAIARFGGFVYRLTPAHGHEHHWHNDLVESRIVAMSVNLGPGSYEGGLLELRERASERVLERVPNTGPGDALFFRIDPSLQHRACPVTSGTKTAFAGWYFGEDSYPRHIRNVAELRAVTA
jgi:2OG-Fe(II) oxygenase superfamily